MEKRTSESSMILQRISRRRARESTNFTIKCWSICAICGERSYQSSQFTAQRCDLEPDHQRLLMGFVLAYQGSRRLQKDRDEQKFPKNTRFDTVRTTISENPYPTQRLVQYAILPGLEHISLVKSTLLSDPAAKLIRLKAHVFSDSTLCRILESRSIR